MENSEDISISGRVTRSRVRRLSTDGESSSRPGTPVQAAASKLLTINEAEPITPSRRSSRRNSTSGIGTKTPIKTPKRKSLSQANTPERSETPTAATKRGGLRSRGTTPETTFGTPKRSTRSRTPLLHEELEHGSKSTVKKEPLFDVVPEEEDILENESPKSSLNVPKRTTRSSSKSPLVTNKVDQQEPLKQQIKGRKSISQDNEKELLTEEVVEVKEIKKEKTETLKKIDPDDVQTISSDSDEVESPSSNKFKTINLVEVDDEPVLLDDTANVDSPAVLNLEDKIVTSTISDSPQKAIEENTNSGLNSSKHSESAIVVESISISSAQNSDSAPAANVKDLSFTDKTPAAVDSTVGNNSAVALIELKSKSFEANKEEDLIVENFSEGNKEASVLLVENGEEKSVNEEVVNIEETKLEEKLNLEVSLVDTTQEDPKDLPLPSPGNISQMERNIHNETSDMPKEPKSNLEGFSTPDKGGNNSSHTGGKTVSFGQKISTTSGKNVYPKTPFSFRKSRSYIEEDIASPEDPNVSIHSVENPKEPEREEQGNDEIILETKTPLKPLLKGQTLESSTPLATETAMQGFQAYEATPCQECPEPEEDDDNQCLQSSPASPDPIEQLGSMYSAETWSQGVVGRASSSLKLDPLFAETHFTKEDTKKEAAKNVSRTASSLIGAKYEPVSSDEEEELDENEKAYEEHPFVEHEAMEVDGYNSGDSMDREEREYLEANEIPIEGESIGSEDTDEPTDSEDERDSFVVSDEESVKQQYSDEEEDLLDEIEEDEKKSDEEESQGSSKKKGFKRIVQQSSSDESCDDNTLDADEDGSSAIDNKKHPNGSFVEKSSDLHFSPNQEQSTIASNTSKLSESALHLCYDANESENNGEKLNESQLNASRKEVLKRLNKSDRFNKTNHELDSDPQDTSSELDCKKSKRLSRSKENNSSLIKDDMADKLEKRHSLSLRCRSDQEENLLADEEGKRKSLRRSGLKNNGEELNTSRKVLSNEEDNRKSLRRSGLKNNEEGQKDSTNEEGNRKSLRRLSLKNDEGDQSDSTHEEDLSQEQNVLADEEGKRKSLRRSGLKNDDEEMNTSRKVFPNAEGKRKSLRRSGIKNDEGDQSDSAHEDFFQKQNVLTDEEGNRKSLRRSGLKKDDEELNTSRKVLSREEGKRKSLRRSGSRNDENEQRDSPNEEENRKSLRRSGLKNDDEEPNTSRKVLSNEESKRKSLRRSGLKNNEEEQKASANEEGKRKSLRRSTLKNDEEDQSDSAHEEDLSLEQNILAEEGNRKSLRRSGLMNDEGEQSDSTHEEDFYQEQNVLADEEGNRRSLRRSGLKNDDEDLNTSRKILSYENIERRSLRRSGLMDEEEENVLRKVLSDEESKRELLRRSNHGTIPLNKEIDEMNDKYDDESSSATVSSNSSTVKIEYYNEKIRKRLKKKIDNLPNKLDDEEGLEVFESNNENESEQNEEEEQEEEEEGEEELQNNESGVEDEEEHKITCDENDSELESNGDCVSEMEEKTNANEDQSESGQEFLSEPEPGSEPEPEPEIRNESLISDEKLNKHLKKLKKALNDSNVELKKLEHLQGMFNPLSKTHRQSLNIASNCGLDESRTHQHVKRLKRQSLGIPSAEEFNPSQSLIGLIEARIKQKVETSKRKRLSRSLDEIGVNNTSLDPDEPICHVNKKSKICLTESDFETDSSYEAAEELQVAAEIHSSTPHNKKEDLNNKYDKILKRCNEIMESKKKEALERKNMQVRKPKSKPNKLGRRVEQFPGKMNVKTKAIQKALKASSKILKETLSTKKFGKPLEVEESNESVTDTESLYRRVKMKKTNNVVSPSSDQENVCKLIKSRAGDFIEEPITPRKKKRAEKPIEIVKTKLGAFKVFPVTPKKKLVSGFVEEALTPQTHSMKRRVDFITGGGRDILPTLSAKTKKRKRRYEEVDESESSFSDTNAQRRRLVAREFVEEELYRPVACKGGTEYFVAKSSAYEAPSTSRQARNFQGDIVYNANALKFKQSSAAGFHVQRVPSKEIHNRKKRLVAHNKF